MDLNLIPSSTVRDYIRAAVAPYVSPCLLSESSLEEIMHIAASFPGTLTNFFGFECPLGRLDGQADFLICASAIDGGRTVLAGAGSAHLPDSFENQFAWRRLFDFARCWNDPLSTLFEKVYNVWVEFDSTGEAPKIPAPSVFFGTRGLQQLSEPGPAGTMPANFAWLIELALPLLQSERLSAAEEASVARCILALPAGAFVFQVGLMLSRPSRVTRICVRGISADQIVGYLQNVGWQGSPVDLGVQVDMLAEYVESFSVDLDVGDGVLPKIGLECYPGLEPDKVAKFLDYLVSAGLARPEKAEAIVAWRGIVHERLNADVWPRDLLAASAILDGRMQSMFHRRLHHVKVVYEPGAALHAKAYLAVQHFWVEPRLLRQALDNIKSRECGSAVLQSAADRGVSCAPAC